MNLINDAKTKVNSGKAANNGKGNSIGYTEKKKHTSIRF